jgi:hypothetical protein
MVFHGQGVPAANIFNMPHLAAPDVLNTWWAVWAW